MATLDCEDLQYHTSLTIEALAFEEITVKTEPQKWQHVRIILRSGNRTLSYETAPRDNDLINPRLQAHLDANPRDASKLAEAVLDINTVADAYVVCRSPQDEIGGLVKHLSELLEDKRPRVMFEPTEPSFELSVESTGGGIKVEMFVDAGNVETGIYRWDALGIRFFTSAAQMRSFIQQLKDEFVC